MEYPSGSFTDLENSPIKSIDDDEIDQILGLFHLEHDYDILYFDIHMIQASLVVASHLNIYTVSTVLSHKNEGVNVVVTNFLSHFLC